MHSVFLKDHGGLTGLCIENESSAGLLQEEEQSDGEEIGVEPRRLQEDDDSEAEGPSEDEVQLPHRRELEMSHESAPGAHLEQEVNSVPPLNALH